MEKRLRDKISKEKIAERKPKIKSAVNCLAEIFPPPAEVLDIGARDGYATALLEGKGYDVLGIDKEIEYVLYASLKHRHVALMDIEAPLLRGGFGKFDIIYARHVIEHCVPKVFFKQCKILLKPKGKVFIVFPMQKLKLKYEGHKAFFPNFRTFEEEIKRTNFKIIFLGLSKEKGIIPYSNHKPEGLFIGQLKGS